MKTLKKSLALILVVFTLFSAVSMLASAAEADGLWINGWDIDKHGVYLVYGDSVFDKVAADKEVKIYCSETPVYNGSELAVAIENGEAELVGAVNSSNVEIVEYSFYGYAYDALYIKPTFDFKKGAYYHFVMQEGLLVSSDGEYYSVEQSYVSAPISSTYFDNDVSFFQKIIDFFRSIIEWFKNLFK